MKKKPGEKILIIGGAGYIGSVLTKTLVENNYDVTVVDIFKNQDNVFNNLLLSENLNIIKADARELKENFLKSFDILIPLAAIVGAPACDRNPTEAISINGDSIKNICKAISKNQMIIFPTTNSGYGTTSGELMCDENTPLNPISLYGKLKKESEEIIMTRENSISFRLATVFGVSPRHRIDLLVNDFVYKAYNDGYLVLFEKHFKRNYIHLKDVSDGFLFAIQNFDNLKGNSFNLGLSEANLSKHELALKIQQYIKKVLILSSEFKEDPDKRNYIVDNSKIESKGFKAKITLDEGIKELIKFYSISKNSNKNV